MSVSTQPVVGPRDIRAFHERMGRVYHQPIRVRSFTNKRFTVNFRVPLNQLRRIVPGAIELDEIRDTGYGMLGMCACDFWVDRLGRLPIPPVRNNDMLCRVSTKIRKRANVYRAYYTLRSDSSSKFLGFFGSRFSHFRKRTSIFERVDDGSQYRLRCHAADPLCRGELAQRWLLSTKIARRRPSFATSTRRRSSCSISTEAADTTTSGRCCRSSESITLGGTCIFATNAITRLRCSTICKRRSDWIWNLTASCSCRTLRKRGAHHGYIATECNLV